MVNAVDQSGLAVSLMTGCNHATKTVIEEGYGLLLSTKTYRKADETQGIGLVILQKNGSKSIRFTVYMQQVV